VLRDGRDCAIIVTGGILEEVWRAAELLEDKGVSVRIVSVHTLKPFDEKTILQTCRETGRIITVEEHTIYGGLGSAVAETLLDYGVHPVAFLRIGLEAGFSSIVGSQQYLRKRYGLDADSISTRIQAILAKGA
jgi:transketolase